MTVYIDKFYFNEIFLNEIFFNAFARGFILFQIKFVSLISESVATLHVHCSLEAPRHKTHKNCLPRDNCT